MMTILRTSKTRTIVGGLPPPDTSYSTPLGARVFHKAELSSFDTEAFSPVTAYLGSRNRLIFMSRHGRRLGWPVFMAYFGASIAKTVIAAPRSSRGLAPRAVAAGVKDFVAMRFGAGSISSFSKQRPGPGL